MLGGRAVAGGGRVEAGAQPWEPGGDLAGSRQAVALPPDIGPSDLGLLPGDEYILTSGALTGQRGFFTRDDRGAVVGIDLAGRFAKRVPTPSR